MNKNEKISILRIIEILEYKIVSNEASDFEYSLYLPWSYKGEDAIKDNKYRCKLMSWYGAELANGGDVCQG